MKPPIKTIIKLCSHPVHPEIFESRLTDDSFPRRPQAAFAKRTSNGVVIGFLAVSLSTQMRVFMHITVISHN